MSKACPSCGEEAITGMGLQDSEVIIVVGIPEEMEMDLKRPLTGSSKDILRREFARLSFDLNSFRIVPIMLHPANKNDMCVKAGMDYVLEEMSGKKAALIVGSEASIPLLGHPAQDINGLSTSRPWINVQVLMACVSPKMAYVKGFGELKFTINNFCMELDRLGVS